MKKHLRIFFATACFFNLLSFLTHEIYGSTGIEEEGNSDDENLIIGSLFDWDSDDDFELLELPIPRSFLLEKSFPDEAHECIGF